MKKEIEEVLAACSSRGRYKGNTELAYQMGVMAAWIARLANTDSAVMRELKTRAAKK